MNAGDYFLLAALLLTFVLTVFACLHLHHRLLLRREEKPHRIVNTTDGKGAFRVHVEQAERKLLGVMVTGIVEGAMPHRDMAVYRMKRQSTPVTAVISGITELPAAAGDRGVRLKLWLFGGKELPEKGDILTNVRPQERMLGYDVSKEPCEPPITVQRAPASVVAALAMTVWGLLLLYFSSAAVLNGDFGAIALLLPVGLAGVLLGGWKTADCLMFSVRFTETEIIITRFGKQRRYLSDGISWQLAANRDDRIIITLRDTNDVERAVLREDCKNFKQAAALLHRQNAERKQQNRWNKFRRPLLLAVRWNTELLTTTTNTSGEMQVLTLQDTSGKSYLPLFAGERMLRSVFPAPDIGVIPAVPDSMEEYTANFTAAEKLVLMTPEESLIITKEEWQKLRSYLHEKPRS